MKPDSTTGPPNLEAIYPLSPMQQGLLFESVFSKSREYFQQVSYTLTGDLNVAALKRAWQEVIDRHQVLRTLFVWERRDRPLQAVRKWVRLPWVEQDWRGLSPEGQERHLEAFLMANREQGFELSTAPLMRLALIRLADDVYQFVWSYHHIIIDGWSGSLVRKEVSEFYEAFCKGRLLDLGSSRPFRDYIAWLQRRDMAQAESFWREALRGFTKPSLLCDARPGEGQSDEQDDYASWGIWVPEPEVQEMQSFVRQHRVTLNTMTQAAWGLLLSYYSHEQDVVFGAVVSGRPPELDDVDSIVGIFINTLPVRVKVSAEEPIATWLKELHARQASAQTYEYTPLVQIAGWSEVPRGQPLFESILVFQSYPQDGASQELSGGVKITNPRNIIRNSYPLTLRAIPGTGLMLQFLYDRPRFETTSIARMMRHLELVMRSMTKQADAKVGSLIELLAEDDRQQRARNEKEFKQSRLQKLKSIKRRGMV